MCRAAKTPSPARCVLAAAIPVATALSGCTIVSNLAHHCTRRFSVRERSHKEAGHVCFDCCQVYWTSILRGAGEVSSHSFLQCASLLKRSLLTRLCLAFLKSRQPSLFRPPRSLDLFHGTLHTRLLSRPPSKSPDRRSVHPPRHWLPPSSGIPSFIHQPQARTHVHFASANARSAHPVDASPCGSV